MIDWKTTVVLAILTLLVAVATLRTDRKVQRRILILLPLPAAILVWRWSTYRGVWLEPIIGLALGGLMTAGWWWRWGRHLPPASSDSIRVWTKDEPFDD